jgi:N-acetylgalactosamine-N,N'-diacetylbacillosaminyl-diphospho-undecaprenol 4-alpha-N-acetylgalactosaminyltransferase
MVVQTQKQGCQMNQKKISIALLINTLGNGGAERVVSLLATHLPKMRYNVIIICLERNVFSDDNFYHIPSDIPIVFLSDNKSSNSGLKKLIELPLLAWKLMRVAVQHDIDIIQSHLFRASYVNAIAQLWAKRLHKRIPIVQMVTPGQITYYDQEGILGKVNLALIRYCYPRAEHLVFKSIEMQYQANQRIKQLSQCHQSVIYNPYDIDAITAQGKQVAEFIFDPTTFYLISVGRLIKLKRIDVILQALTMLPSSTELILVGNGADEAHFKQLTRTLDLDKRVHFVGSQKNPFSYLTKAQLFILSSETEGFPNVLVEAMLSHIPVLASDCISGPREILAPKSNPLEHLQIGNPVEWTEYGGLYAVGDATTLASAIVSLQDDRLKMQQLATAAYQRATDFSLSHIISRYDKVIQRAVTT